MGGAGSPGLLQAGPLTGAERGQGYRRPPTAPSHRRAADRQTAAGTRRTAGRADGTAHRAPPRARTYRPPIDTTDLQPSGTPGQRLRDDEARRAPLVSASDGRAPALHWPAGGPDDTERVAAPAVERDADGYADLRTYAVIGDGRTVALVARDGRIDWMPLPDLDSVVPFAALLDAEDGGCLELAPVEPYEVEREYVRHTDVLTTTFRTASGSVRVTDALTTGVAGRLPWAELVRRVEGLEGRVRLRASVRPGTCLGTAAPWVRTTPEGALLRVDGLTTAVVTGLLEAGDDGGGGGARLERQDREREVVLDLETCEGSRHVVGLVATEREPLWVPSASDLDADLDRTVENWRTWTRTFLWDGPWDEAVRRSALVLKLLLHSPSGAMAAAATTSLPEDPSGSKCWDYRYAWVRDSAYSLEALLRFGLREEPHAAVSWLLRTIRQDGQVPEVFYSLGGEVPDDGVSELQVPGWRGAGPVVEGNGAASQLQLGVYGDLFSIVRLYVDAGGVLDAETGRLLAATADAACDRWRQRDAGMWELHEPRHYTTSKMGCWLALTAAVHLAELGQVPGDPARWRSEAELIRTWVAEHCWSEELGAYTWYPGTDDLDASVLLHAVSGFDRGERMSSTLDALRRELSHGPHLYRYTGAAAEEGAFVACSFWMVSALQLCGRGEEARALMDALVDGEDSALNDVGVLAEMLDPATGHWLGNLPQALSHLALVNAAITVHEHSRED
ncbi:glycoside hydrolase family 15 protein [Quadrisphaera sp. INWT6]|uniref:glycoside hydrolase family 15 protein n=1 Tax=Quadrisphaera sp. INWT6 TaxID=2596917 RepID=UPI001891FEAC|nr:glycoside hydrolase family 15 protein [Quadrisphaera sp. INWT6]MBF5082462.1 glycoside hydrolase family 15 protein [Quadrisphaera sp. INWT6]